MKKEKDTITFLKEKVSSLLMEDEKSRTMLIKNIDELKKKNMDEYLYANLLELFVHLSFSEEEAKKHWKNIFENYRYLQSKIDRTVGLRVAMFDYFINLNRMLSEPILVEIWLFKETEKMAMVDALTGLFNRRYFDLSLKKELKRAHRHDKIFSLLMIDIDNFKVINDSKGHPFGDIVLKKLGAGLKESCREEDILCRYGGEEFVFILPETNGGSALVFAERLRNTIRNNSFFKKHRIFFSGGIASYPFDGMNANKLIRNADKALYAAKFAGKDCIIKSRTENRRYIRYTQSLKIFFKPVNIAFRQSDVRQVYSQDISLGGIKFESYELLQLDSKLLLDISLPDKNEVVLVGTVIWFKKIDNTLYRYGVRYDDITHEQLVILRQFLDDTTITEVESGNDRF
ncbi:MAG: diguanylate cyclase [Spirochaetales bacterium]|nr:diguanylate cyclase [Spirochaetales bacterium]